MSKEVDNKKSMDELIEITIKKIETLYQKNSAPQYVGEMVGILNELVKAREGYKIIGMNRYD